MRLLNIFVFPAFFLLSPGSLPAYTGEHTPDSLTIVHIAQEEGLSQLGALAMDFDETGYLWVSAECGVNRCSGYQTCVYNAGDEPEQLPYARTRSMYYANETLWLATNTHSVVAYLRTQDRFIKFGGQPDTDRH